MNAKMKELLAEMQEKRNLAKSFTKENSKDIEKALALLDEADALEKEFEAERRLVELDKAKAVANAKPAETSDEERQAQITKNFLSGVRSRFKEYTGQREGVDADGGYVVPQDILTQINHFKQAEFSLLPLVEYHRVTTNKGSRTFESRATATSFGQIDEAGTIEQIENLQFQAIKYDIKNYAGFLPVTNQLLADTDAALRQTIAQWFARKIVATDNRLILDQLKSKGSVDLGNLDGIKRALNVTLGQAFKSTSRIVTNDDGLQYLDTLKDANGRELLQPNPSDPIKLQLRAGMSTVAITVVPNNVLKTEGNQLPIIIGDFKESIIYWDRQQYLIDASNVAAIGNVNAFAQNLTLFRCLSRQDVTIKDPNSWVYGTITDESIAVG